MPRLCSIDISHNSKGGLRINRWMPCDTSHNSVQQTVWQVVQAQAVLAPDTWHSRQHTRCSLLTAKRLGLVQCDLPVYIQYQNRVWFARAKANRVTLAASMCGPQAGPTLVAPV